MTDTITRDVHASADAGGLQTNRQNAEKGFPVAALTRPERLSWIAAERRQPEVK